MTFASVVAALVSPAGASIHGADIPVAAGPRCKRDSEESDNLIATGAVDPAANSDGTATIVGPSWHRGVCDVTIRIDRGRLNLARAASCDPEIVHDRAMIPLLRATPTWPASTGRSWSVTTMSSRSPYLIRKAAFMHSLQTSSWSRR